MPEGFNIDILSGKARELATNIDNNNIKDNSISGKEISIFIKACKENKINIFKEPWFNKCRTVLMKHFIKETSVDLQEERFVEKNDATRVVSNTRQVYDVTRENTVPEPKNLPNKDFGANSDIRTDYDWSVEDFNKVLDAMINAPKYKGKYKGSVLEGQGEAFIKAAKEFNIDPRILVAIAMCESERGISDIAKNMNNVGGLKKDKNTYYRYESIYESICSIAKTLDTRYNAGHTTPMKIAYSGKYCAKEAAPIWLKNVRSFLYSFNEIY